MTRLDFTNTLTLALSHRNVIGMGEEFGMFYGSLAEH